MVRESTNYLYMLQSSENDLRLGLGKVRQVIGFVIFDIKDYSEIVYTRQ